MASIAQQIADYRAPKEVAEGWYRAIVKDNEVATSKSGNEMFTTTFLMLRDAEKPSSAFKREQKTWTVVPEESHKAVTFLSDKLAQFIHAMELQGVVQPPRTSEGMTNFKGGVIDGDPKSVKAATTEAIESALTSGVAALKESPKSIVDTCVYVKFEYETNKDTGERMFDDQGRSNGKIVRVAANLPWGTSLVDPEKALVSV